MTTSFRHIRSLNPVEVNQGSGGVVHEIPSVNQPPDLPQWLLIVLIVISLPFSLFAACLGYRDSD